AVQPVRKGPERQVGRELLALDVAGPVVLRNGQDAVDGAELLLLLWCQIPGNVWREIVESCGVRIDEVSEPDVVPRQLNVALAARGTERRRLVLGAGAAVPIRAERKVVLDAGVVSIRHGRQQLRVATLPAEVTFVRV